MIALWDVPRGCKLIVVFGPTVNLTHVMSLTVVSSRRCQLGLCYRLLVLRSRFLGNFNSVSVSCFGFSVMNSVTGLVGVIVCFSFVDSQCGH